MSDRYEYNNLSAKSKETLKIELNEVPEQVNAHIESFRRWVRSMHHLKCPTNAEFLIKFLRVAKFDHKKAQQRLDNFCTVRSSPRGSPKFFEYFSIDDPIIEKAMDLKQQTPLGFNDAGEMVVLIRPKLWNPDEIPFDQLIKVMFMVFDCMMAEEAVQIHGMSMLMDLSDVSRKAFEVWGDPKLNKQLMRIMQDSLPVRMKNQIFYNEPVIFDILFQIISFFMNEKMKSRTLRVKHDIKKAIDKVPGLERILPTEYGGQNGTFDECAARWKAKFYSYHRGGNMFSGIDVNEAKRPKETADYLKEYSDYQGATLGTAGTYTKFENVY